MFLWEPVPPQGVWELHLFQCTVRISPRTIIFYIETSSNNCYLSSYPAMYLLCWATSIKFVIAVVIGACSLSLYDAWKLRYIMIMLCQGVWVLQLDPLWCPIARLSRLFISRVAWFHTHHLLHQVSCLGWPTEKINGSGCYRVIRHRQRINACS